MLSSNYGKVCTAQPADNKERKKRTKAAQRQRSRAERCTVHGACGRHSKRSEYSLCGVSRGCRSSPNCFTTSLTPRTGGENTAQILSPLGGQSSAQVAFARLHTHTCTRSSVPASSRGGKPIPPCAAVYHRRPDVLSRPDGSLLLLCG